MRSKLGKAVRARFAARLRGVLPQFREIKTAEIPPGSRLYCWERAPDLSFYLLLLVFPQWDEFTIEVAWSRKGQFPDRTMFCDPDEEPQDGTLGFRLGRLWEVNKGVWWQLTEYPSPAQLERSLLTGQDVMPPVEEIMPNVIPMVDDAINRIVEYAVPYFTKVAKKYGYE